MTLSQKAIKEFKKAYLQDIGKIITDEEADAKGLELLKFFQLIYRPIPKEYETK